MIEEFKCKETVKIWHGEVSTRLPYDIQNIARRKLRMIASAVSVESLKIPPANHLKKLKGERIGTYSIRINDQWRICFEWRGENAYGVEIVDYH